MYTLTLTADERKAFDWVGNRYATGDDWSKILGECMPEDKAWCDDEEITFSIPEAKAWELNELADSEDSRFPCFSSELTSKLESFLARIV